MTAPATSEEPRAVLLYAGLCGKCRFLSRLIVLLSLGSIERLPLERREAEDFYIRKHPQARGNPVLVEGEKLTYGFGVFFSIPRFLLRSWLARMAQLRRRSGGASQ